MSDSNESNSGLYFIVGALVVAVLVLGFFLLGKDTNNNDPVQVIERTIEKTTDNVKDTGNNIKLNIDENGVSGSISQED